MVNENDSVCPAEIGNGERLFGDNDVLSAVVASLCRASKLIILSDVDGFYDADPHMNPEARIIETVDAVDADLRGRAGSAGTARGRGGMKTKLRAAEMAMDRGIDTVICNGRQSHLIYDALEGRPAGTLFVGKSDDRRTLFGCRVVCEVDQLLTR